MNKIKDKKKILIYGAGMVGGLVLLRLKRYGVDNSRIAFIVTNATPNQKYKGYDVFSVSDFVWEKEEIAIVATIVKSQKQLIKCLESVGVTDYLTVDDELFADMERGYISDRKSYSCNIEEKGNRDILIISSDNNYSSGAFLCMIDLYKEIVSAGLRPFVVLPGYGNGEEILKENKIEYTIIQSRSGLYDSSEKILSEPYMNQDAIREIKWLIKKLNIKLVHNNSTHTYVGAVAAKQAGVPYVWHIRENIQAQGLCFFDRQLFNNLINESDKIIAVSSYVADCYPDLNKSKVIRIYDGVNVDKYYCRRELFLNSRVKILMPGAIIPLKGQIDLIEAAAILRDYGCEFLIDFVGSGEADYIRLLELTVDQYSLCNFVNFTERVNNLEEWYKNADIVVVCSRSEAFGRVTVEGQLSGCIVVGASCGATTELIQDRKIGYLYDSMNANSLSKVLLEILNDKKAASKVAKRGQKAALRKYNKAINCKKIVDEYIRIVER